MSELPSEEGLICQSQKSPDGWHRIRFEEVAKKVNNLIDRKSCDLTRYVAGEHMQTDDFRIKEWGIVGDGYLGPAFNHKFTKGQILYGSRRTYLRKVSIPHFDGICANTTFVIEPEGHKLLPELLPFVMQSAPFNEHSVKMSKGSTNPYINWKDIACYEFYVPDKPQQQRIAALLWSAEDCIVKNERFIEWAERAKQVLMRELFSKGIGHTEFKNFDDLGDIPKEWAIKKIDEIKANKPHSLSMGPFGSNITIDNFIPSGIPVLRGINLGSHIVNDDDLVFISEKKADELSASNAFSKDIVITHRGTIGQFSIIPEISTYNRYVVSQSQMKLSCNENLANPYFINYYFNSQLGQVRFLKHKIHTGVPAIAQPISTLKNIIIPIPPLIEQNKIVNIINNSNTTISAAQMHLINLKALKMKLINQFFRSPGDFT